MKISNDVKKMMMPIYLIWIALIISMLVYLVLLIYLGKTALVDTRDISNMKNIIFPMSFIPFVFTFIFSRKMGSLVRKSNMDKAPYARGLNKDDASILSYYGSYFIIHIIMWALNEAGAIFGFVLTMMSGNIQYYAITATIAIIINLVFLRPDYIEFIKGKKLE